MYNKKTVSPCLCFSVTNDPKRWSDADRQLFTRQFASLKVIQHYRVLRDQLAVLGHQGRVALSRVEREVREICFHIFPSYFPSYIFFYIYFIFFFPLKFWVYYVEKEQEDVPNVLWWNECIHNLFLFIIHFFVWHHAYRVVLVCISFRL